MRFLFSILSLVVLLMAASPQPELPRKIALVIAIGNYDSSTGWKTISSANDINFIKPTLLSQGFSESDIEIIQNEKATKEGIINSIDRLIAKAQAGDIIVFHFSGHGQQVFDDANKDEADGYDEALVPYNANMRYGGGYTGQNHIRDDELGTKLKLLRKKIGKQGSLLVLLDACHSGTGTRGQDISITRGSEAKCEPEGYKNTISGTRGGSSAEGVFDDRELLSNMVVISAASADQLNYETKDNNNNGVGALSYAFSRALAQSAGPLNYKILFEKIKTDIQSWKPYQNPQIEGNTEQQVLGGKFIPSTEIVRISRWNSDNSIEIPRGIIHSINTGTRFDLYPVEVTDFKASQPVASGVVSEALMGKSTGVFSGSVPPKDRAYNIVFQTKSFGDMSVAVKINLSDAVLSSQVREKFKAFHFIVLDKPNADISFTQWVDPSTKEKSLQLVAANDSVLWEKEMKQNASQMVEESAEDIVQKIKQYSRAQFLRGIQTAPDAKVFEYVQVEVIPGIIRTINGVDTLIQKKDIKEMTNSRGDIQFREANDESPDNEGFVIRVRNLHDYSVYISVLDIMPDNAVAVLMPDPSDENSTAEDYKIAAKQTYTSRPIKLYPPFGKDFMKILVTRQAMDLKAIQSRSTSRGAGSSFENFYNESFMDDQSEKSRGGKMTAVKVDEIKIVPFTFNIVPAKK